MKRIQKECGILKLHVQFFVLIVGKLPLQEIVQLRCVCKTWKDLLTKGHCFQHLLEMLSQTPLYVVPLKTRFAAYSSETKSWHRWPSAVHRRLFSSMFKVHGEIGDWLLVEDLSVVKNTELLPDLCLINSRKTIHRKLPSLSERTSNSGYESDCCALGLVAGGSSESHKVFIINSQKARPDPYSDWIWMFYVYWYDSELDLWKAYWLCPEMEGEVIDSVVFYEGVLHCNIREVTKLEESCLALGTKVCRYDELNSCWQAISAQISEDLRVQHLFLWHGHLMLIGAQIGRQHNNIVLTMWAHG